MSGTGASLRIVAGRLKGLRLEGPSWRGLRPTADRLRETLFNVVDCEAGGRSFLDAYAGTGGVGLEALSRGASRVTFVDADERATRLIAQNVARARGGDACIIVTADVAVLPTRLGGRQPFDVVFLDPPYDCDDLASVLAPVEHLVEPGSLVVLEHRRQRSSPECTGSLVRRRVMVAGDSALSFYACRSAEPT